MRILAACLVGALGLGALMTMGACSDSTDTGSAGAGGAAGASTAGAGGKPATAGATSTAGTGGGPPCKFESAACQACIGESCQSEAGACVGEATCATPLFALQDCACDPDTVDTNDCFETFVSTGDTAEEFVKCFADNCAAKCQ